ncbi:hypothetical protein [Actinomyces urogenitalis]|uniref:hypothetical protein n=1 Tax=Actinomyces urogenitalis TaxID=103621 RepID=UPI0029044FCC|nr:hypothetical protein [Actinomyces urogenitalis]MDU0864422.1 hypothetical protein [Actinomyces urogenitalis]MDU0874968.1 hypothetical protein [Actinomyces urogenitalis]MDU1565361.1 hypothetical protein [Actinomyces urogenitalis]MDU1640604.1 hypothetical protein [Actinomyces urogenitalis]MDU6777778.1 hypothetical protein [Actinomyces urogenitalis]
MYATIKDLAAADIDTADSDQAGQRLNLAEIAVASYLRGVIYDPDDPRVKAVLRRATIAQYRALADAGVDPTNPSGGKAVVASKSLQSASITYAGADAQATLLATLRAGGLSGIARAILQLAGLTPTVRVVG